MPRANAIVPTEAIRIEDEVWQEAFARREPARPSRERRLRAIDGDLPDWLVETTGKTLADAASWSVPRPAGRETPVAQAPAGWETAAAQTPAAQTTAALPFDPRMSAEPPTPVVPAASAQAGAASAQAGAAPARRIVKIQGRGAERNLPLPDSSRRRPPRRAYERTGFRPDRLAMWAVMLGFLLVLIAIVSAH